MTPNPIFNPGPSRATLVGDKHFQHRAIPDRFLEKGMDRKA